MIKRIFNERDSKFIHGMKSSKVPIYPPPVTCWSAQFFNLFFINCGLEKIQRKIHTLLSICFTFHHPIDLLESFFTVFSNVLCEKRIAVNRNWTDHRIKPDCPTYHSQSHRDSSNFVLKSWILTNMRSGLKKSWSWHLFWYFKWILRTNTQEHLTECT